MTIQRPVSLHGDLENDPFRHSYNQWTLTRALVSDMFEASKPEDEPGRCVLKRLQSTEKVGWETSQRTIAVIQLAKDQSSDKRLEDGIARDKVTELSRVCMTRSEWTKMSRSRAEGTVVEPIFTSE